MIINALNACCFLLGKSSNSMGNSPAILDCQSRVGSHGLAMAGQSSGKLQRIQWRPRDRLSSMNHKIWHKKGIVGAAKSIKIFGGQTLRLSVQFPLWFLNSNSH